jgi:hypothetical protein
MISNNIYEIPLLIIGIEVIIIFCFIFRQKIKEMIKW